MPEPAEQVTVLPALVAAAPARAEIATTSLGGYISVHWTAVGSLPAVEVKVRFRETAPFAAETPEDRANEPVCPSEGYGKSKKAIAKHETIQPLVCWLLISIYA
jgi:hypothetical protein